MTGRRGLTRRRFLGTVAATGSTILWSGPQGLLANPSPAPGTYPATDHFWYRLQPEGPYLDSQRGHRAFGFSDAAVFLSQDNGRSWPHRAEFPAARHITFSHIFANGNVLFCTRTRVFLSTDNLQSYRQITVQHADGSAYMPHTPQNPEHPGWYFATLSGVNSWQVD